MLVFETIRRRRSISKMSERRPTRAQIERMLEAATHAPNHHRVEPWKFIIFSGAARQELGEAMAQALALRLGQGKDEKTRALIEKERQKPLRAPVVIVVAAEAPQRPEVRAIENIEAVAAAVQNMLLTAEEQGLATMWRTGEAAYDPQVKAWLGLAPEDEIVAFLYVGYPALSPPARIPTDYRNKTRWQGDLE
ncbi:MAG: nitroreductase [Thermogemmatispora sp.]|uniref:nitroreductase family protein n=1 Tax=Thermogemmatispora sp. TaxID=1968838 RepID=UPI002606D3FF|nr:nitroreductase [Thermogemmatispora sp.]MBX5458049.1 nitroreductase [Thermogemmatispora sp.]